MSATNQKAPQVTNRISGMWRVVAALALIAGCGIVPAPEAVNRAILGQRPDYGPASVSEVPNLAALDRLIWMPGLGAGWDPQGLAVAENSLFVAGYRSSGAWQNRGPCRVFRVDPKTGKETGHLDVPPPCGHAGGLAYAGHGKLFVTDTHALFEVDLDQAFTQPAPKFRFLRLGQGLKGAFAVSGERAIWIGGYDEDRPATVFKFTLATLESLPEGDTLAAAAATTVLPVPTYAQGGAIDASGALWIARSDIGWGFLDKLDPASGRLERRFPVPAAIEGIAFDHHGRLWCVSEAGARHLPWHFPFFPLIFRLDPARLATTD